MFSFFRKVKETPKHEVLQALKAMDLPEEAYEGKTAEEVQRFRETLQQTINDIIEEENNGMIREKVDFITTKRIALREKMEKAQNAWENHKETMRKSVEKGVEFVQTTNFYPPEYVFHLNKIEGFITDMTELQEKDPLASPDEFLDFCTQTEQDILLFTQLHQETILLMDKIDQKMTQKQKLETQAMIEIKESLFRALQMGHLLQARSDIKKLRKEYKRF